MVKPKGILAARRGAAIWRSKADHMALIAAIKEGIIDAIAIDHRPYTYEEKTVSFLISASDKHI